MELVLLCHPATRAMKTGRFPAGDEPADDTPHAPLPADDTARVISSPARAAREMAACIAPDVDIDAAFDDIDYGSWRGRSIRELADGEAAQLSAWLTDPQARPHGGESIALLAARVIKGLARVEREMRGERCIVVTHAIVVKVAVAHALRKPLTSIYAMNFAPCSVTVLNRSPGAQDWTVSLPPPA
ncbi:histidine phosphatase family protein [Caballeronia sp. LZ034LL]|uniref:histidine phosphatase family protein n=1 Tax=Caballeronia sp. LZ034LL TaxID=3038567 RepID=UPI002865CF76|nr:histidine phosphatase family protein [Caballeronia sp. LZ034LL]MDR5838864.1 histidine phosphatase family protein [Caballeronia sp. LZ034LL]